jgi:eukaryotic-like serine/threonine-protein kinase
MSSPNQETTVDQSPTAQNITQTFTPNPADASHVANENLMRAESPSLDSLRFVDVPGYQIECILGRGGMGVVFKARQDGLDRTVALKLILSGTHAKEDELIRFLAEAETAALLQHQGIAQIYGIDQVNGLPYFAMEFVDGGSLAEWIRRGRLAMTDAVHIASLLVEAVGYAHKSGVVHRDLKPANILMTSDGIPKITDFGLAKRLETGVGVTQTGNILGTPSYMSPEQARGDLKSIGPSGDVYSLGCVLYELLTGQTPFRAENTMELLS